MLRTLGSLAEAFGLKRKAEAKPDDEPASRRRKVIPAKEFKCVIIGDGGVGKTSLVKRFQTGEHGKKYVPTIGVDIGEVRFETSEGPIVFKVWDTAGQDKFAGLGDGYYLGSNCALVMFDVSSRITYANVPKWFTSLKNACGKIPCVLVGNKVDLPGREVAATKIQYHRTHGIQYYDVSVKNQFNFERPFLYLARKLTGKPDLTFIGEFAKAPLASLSLASSSSQSLAEQRASLEEAANVAIGDSDDDL